jgi:hypothetical protein
VPSYSSARCNRWNTPKRLSASLNFSACAEARGAAAARGDNAPMLRVVGPRSQRYNAVSTGVAGAGDVTVPRIATRERRHDHALRR